MDFCVHNYIEETRLAKLTSLQEKFLKHAMNAFPKAKRIIYSTCSLYPEENERVVTNVVKTSRAKWRVQDVKELLKGQWNNFGSGMYGSMGTRCMYAKPDTDFTTGFFLAVLDRDEKDLAKAYRQEEKASDTTKEAGKSNEADNLEVGDENGVDVNEIKKRKKNLNNDTENEDTEKPKKKKKRDKNQEINLEANIEESPKKKKDKRKLNDVVENLADLSVEGSGTEVPRKKKKKDKQQNKDHDTPIENSQDISNDISEGAEKKSKKKKSKVKDDEQLSEVVISEQKVKKKLKVAEID